MPCGCTYSPADPCQWCRDDPNQRADLDGKALGPQHTSGWCDRCQEDHAPIDGHRLGGPVVVALERQVRALHADATAARIGVAVLAEENERLRHVYAMAREALDHWGYIGEMVGEESHPETENLRAAVEAVDARRSAQGGASAGGD